MQPSPENVLEINDSRSFYNAYIPVIALLLAFYLAVPQFMPRTLSPNASEPLITKRLITASIPVRTNGKARPTRRLQEIIGLAKFHRLSASLSYAVSMGMTADTDRSIHSLTTQLDAPVYRKIRAASTPKLRVCLVTAPTEAR